VAQLRDDTRYLTRSGAIVGGSTQPRQPVRGGSSTYPTTARVHFARVHFARVHFANEPAQP
jgi:hypothetical protein